MAKRLFKMTRAEAIKALRAHVAKFPGASAEVNVNTPEILDVWICAPDGYLWEGEDLHSIVVCIEDMGNTSKPGLSGKDIADAVADAIQRMAGVEKCEREGCEVCW